MTELGEKILSLRDEGYTYSQIKEELGCSKGVISYWAGEGQKTKQIKRVAKNKEKAKNFLRDLKESTPCTDCGVYYPYWVMDFDHLKDKLFPLSGTHVTKGMRKILKEIDKCEIVCSNCHRMRTHNRRASVSPDGPNVLEG